MAATYGRYVKLVEGYMMVGDSQRASEHLDALREEATAKGINLGHEATTPLLNCLNAGKPI